MWAQQQMESAVWSLNLKSLPMLVSLFLRSSYDKMFGSDGVIHLVGDFLPSCQEYRETWERTEWGGSRRNGERALQNCSCKQSIERNWTLMTVMSCSEILCLFCSFILPLSEWLCNRLRSWYIEKQQSWHLQTKSTGSSFYATSTPYLYHVTLKMQLSLLAFQEKKR